MTLKARLTLNNHIKASKIIYQTFNPKLVKSQVQNLAALKIVRNKKIYKASNHILTIISKNSKQTRTFYKLKIEISKHLSIQVLAAIETWLGII